MASAVAPDARDVVVPQDDHDELERVVLSAMLLDSRQITKVLGIAPERAFRTTRHQRIVRALVHLDAQGLAGDPVTLADELNRRGELAAIGGKDYIGQLIDAADLPEHVEHYARLLLEAYQRRQLVEVHEHAAELARRGALSPAELRATFERELERRELAGLALSAVAGLGVRSDADVEQLPRITWLVDQMLPQSALSALYGSPGSGKSFLALDLALTIAAASVWNVSWMGRAVMGGGVLYLAAEGVGGLGQRVRSWKESHGLAGYTLGVGFVTNAVDLLDASTATRIVNAVRQVPAPLQLVVVDTLARSMVGDENDTGDMSRLIATVDRVRTMTQSHVMLVHHTRKDSELERGSTALRGGVDTLIFCQEGDDGRQLVCQKQKDAEAFAPMPFSLVAGHGSCVVAFTGVGSSAGPAGPGDALTPPRLKTLRALADGFTARGATASEWLKASDIAERTFFRVRTWLVSNGYAAESGSRYTMTPSGRFAATAVRGSQSPTATTATQLPRSLPGAVAPPRPLRAGGASLAGNSADGSSHEGNGSNGLGDDDYWPDLLSDVEHQGEFDD
jgi:hypothetical protein